MGRILRYGTAWIVLLLFSLVIILFLLCGAQRGARPLVSLWARCMLRVLGVTYLVEGEIPSPERPTLIAASHTSALDLLLYPAIFGWNAAFVGKSDLRHIPLFGWAFAAMGNILVRRGGGRTEGERITADARRICMGRHIFIHPEGTRSLTGDVLPLKKGFVFLAMALGRDVTPAAAPAAQNLWPKGRSFPVCGQVRVRFGKPLSTLDWSEETAALHAMQTRQAMQALHSEMVV